MKRLEEGIHSFCLRKNRGQPGVGKTDQDQIMQTFSGHSQGVPCSGKPLEGPHWSEDLFDCVGIRCSGEVEKANWKKS